MLHIYIKNIHDIRKAAENHEKVEGLDLIWDIDFEFKGISLVGDTTERQVIKDVEQGRYVDNLTFIDQYGVTLPRDFLSTGCKTVLLALHHPTKIVSTAECGKNALGAIISYCKEGNILLYTCDYKIPYPNSQMIDIIDVECEGRKFNSFIELNRYISNK